MKEKLKYNLRHIILFTILNFITAFYYVALKVVAFFVIPSNRIRRQKVILSSEEEKILKKAS